MPKNWFVAVLSRIVIIFLPVCPFNKWKNCIKDITGSQAQIILFNLSAAMFKLLLSHGRHCVRVAKK